MTTEKKAFVLYFDALDALRELPREQVGELLLLLYEAAMACAEQEGDLNAILDRNPNLLPETRSVFRFMAQNIQRDSQLWRETRSRRRRKRSNADSSAPSSASRRAPQESESSETEKIREMRRYMKKRE